MLVVNIYGAWYAINDTLVDSIVMISLSMCALKNMLLIDSL